MTDEEFWKQCVLAVLGATPMESASGATKTADAILRELKERRKKD